jgi:hypothetical protein
MTIAFVLLSVPGLRHSLSALNKVLFLCRLQGNVRIHVPRRPFNMYKQFVYFINS